MLCKSRYLHDSSDLLPLLWSRVGPCWVVCTGMEDKDGELRSTLWRRRLCQLRRSRDIGQEMVSSTRVTVQGQALAMFSVSRTPLVCYLEIHSLIWRKSQALSFIN